MTPSEAIKLCRLVKACCPQQQIDEYTPDAWGELLGDLRLVDCVDAVKDIARRQAFIAPCEIRDQVRRIRNERIDRAGTLTPPPELSDGDYGRWLYETRRAIADGGPVPTYELPERRPMPALENVFRRIPSE